MRQQREQPPLGVEGRPVGRGVVGSERAERRRSRAARPSRRRRRTRARAAPARGPPRGPRRTRPRRRGRPRRPSRARARRRRRRAPRARAAPPGSASQRRPAASAAYSPGATSARVLTNANDSSSNCDAEGLVDVAAADALEPPHARGRWPRAPRRRGSPQRVEQAAAGGLDLVEHLLEAVRAAVVRVGDVEVGRAGARPGRTRAAAAPCPPRRRPAENVRSSRRFSRSIASSRSKCSKSRGRTWRAAPSSVIAARRGGGRRAAVGRVAGVPGAGARAVDLELVLEAGLAHEAAHDALGRRRAADVAHAHEEDRFKASNARSSLRHSRSARTGAARGCLEGSRYLRVPLAQEHHHP